MLLPILGIVVWIVISNNSNKSSITGMTNGTRSKKTKTLQFDSLLNNRISNISLNPENLDQINQELAKLSLDQVLQWSYQTFQFNNNNNNNNNSRRNNNNIINKNDSVVHTVGPYPMVDMTSFGPSGMVILHKLNQLGYTQSIPVITIDTLHLFPETYEFIQQFQDDNNNKNNPNSKRTNDNDQRQQQLLLEHDPIPFVLPLLKVYRPKGYNDKVQFDKAYGSDLYETNADKYSYLSKVEPTVRALQDHQVKVWITGRRQSQGGERSKLSILELDGPVTTTTTTTTTTDTASPSSSSSSSSSRQQQWRYKLNPLAYWSYDDVWDYIRKYKVPYNPLHDQGYKSIGDTMTTQPVDGSDDERSGRFVGMDRSECGIHSIGKKIQKMLQDQQQDQQHNVSDAKKKKKKLPMLERPTLPCTGCLELNSQMLLDILKTSPNGKTMKTTTTTTILPNTDFVLVEFYSPLCGHCRRFAPTFDLVATELFNDTFVDVVRMDMTKQQILKEAVSM